MEYLVDDQRHLVCKPYSVENLHAMAADLGIKRCWFHANHYVVPKRRVCEIRDRCRVVRPREILAIILGVSARAPELYSIDFAGSEHDLD